MKKSFFAVSSVSLALMLGVGAAIAQDAEPIRIGVAVAQTSNVALLGQEQVIGAEIAAQYFNDLGGINGRPIELVIQDTAGDEAGAINAFNTVIAEGVVGIVGPTLSQQAFAADPIAEAARVPVIAPSNTARGIPEIGAYIARVSAPVALVAPNAVRTALEFDPEIQRVAVFFAQNDAFATSETGTFQETVTALGLELLPVQTFQTTDTDFTTQITNILPLNPDLAIVSGLAADGGNLVRQLRELGYEGLIVGGNGLNTANIFPVCQAFCDGILIAQAYSYSYENEVNSAFRDIYFEQQGKEPPQFSGQAFAGVQVFVEALIELDNTVGLDTLDLAATRDQLNTTLLGLTYDTPLGVISFTPEGEINQGTFYVAQISMNEDGQTGSFVFVNTIDVTAEATPEATPAS
ncbi:MAG: ABC transporter substrate-binding protein [Pleurocapsa minor GSE-CHR-MK-17-07R]|jgi:branched-chain amino acid transport system substrate-binding protein|nr:ABC transporter substrate-binding protein [Pleurocapsa minor GSE-CHR-MK 17-07R]